MSACSCRNKSCGHVVDFRCDATLVVSGRGYTSLQYVVLVCDRGRVCDIPMEARHEGTAGPGSGGAFNVFNQGAGGGVTPQR